MRVSRKFNLTVAAALVLMASFGLSGIATASPQPKPDVLSKAILSYFTEIERMQAPSWMMPGQRVVYKITMDDLKEPAKSFKGYLVYDIVDVKGDYVASFSSSSQEAPEGPLGLVYSSSLYDHPATGRFWITPAIFKDGTLPDQKKGMLFSTSLTMKGTRYDAGVLSFESPTAERTMAFDKDTGLLLIVQMTVNDANGAILSKTEITYEGIRLSMPPWYGMNLEGLATDTLLTYKATYFAKGIPDQQKLVFKVAENNGAWVVLDRTFMPGEGEPSTTQIISASSTGDGFLPWLPTDLLGSFKEGQLLYEEDITGTTVTAMGIANDAAHGMVARIVFADRAAQIECRYSLATGYLVSLHQKPMADAVPEVIYELESVR